MLARLSRTSIHRSALRGAGAACLAAAGIAGLPGIALAQAPECAQFGRPSYTADRTLTVGGRSFASKVFVSGRQEREEVALGSEMEVRIISPTGFVTFNPDKKVGLRRPAPRVPGKPAPGNFRVNVSDQGGSKVVRTEGRREDGGWDLVAEATCRADGVPLSRRFFAPIGGQLVESRLSQSNIAVGPVDRARFAVPADIKFVR